MSAPMENLDSTSIQSIIDFMVPDPRTYEGLIEELNACMWQRLEEEVVEETAVVDVPQAIYDLAEILHRKSLAEERLIGIFADCAGDVSRMLQKRERDDIRKAFSNALLKRCQDSFNEFLVLKLDEEDEYADNKAKKLTNMRVIAELYIRCILPSESVTPFLDVLTGVGSDIPPSTDNIEALKEFVVTTSTSLDPVTGSAVASRVRRIHDTHPSHRVRQMLSEFIDFSQYAATVDSSAGGSEAPSSPSDMSFPMSSPPNLDLAPIHPGKVDIPLQRMGSYPMVISPQSSLARKTKKDHKAYQLQQQQRRDCTVYVVGIDASLPESELLSFIAQCGHLVKVRLCGDTTNRTIYGFFEFDCKESSDALVAKTGSVLGSYTIHCSFARQAIRDLSHGPADSKIRTLNFDKSHEDTSLRESILNDPTWFKSQGRFKTGKHPVGIAAYGNGWDANRIPEGAPHSRHLQTLHGLVRHLVQTHSVPAGVTLQMCDLATAFASTAIGEGEWSSLTDYMPPFLRTVEV